MKEILIVGAGPTGLTLGCELLRRGIPCRIIDKMIKPSPHSKALGVSASSLQIFERLGFASDIVDNSIKMEDTYFYWKGKKFSHTNYRYLEFTRYPFMLLTHQTVTEQYLTQCLESLGGVVERGVELVNLTQDKDKVYVVLKHIDNRIESVCYEEIVGCDGSRSVVREKIGIDFHGKDYGMHFIYGDFELEGNVPKDKSIAHYYLDGSNLLILLPSPKEIYRVVGLIQGDKENRPNPTMSDLQLYLDTFGPGDITLKNPTQLGSVPIYYRITNEVNIGRVFLAGDAFHLFSPIGGQGMNSGIQDAYNLAWKLAYVKRGISDRKLLDTYKEERLPLVSDVIQNVVNSVEFILSNNKENSVFVNQMLPIMRNRNNFRDKGPKNYSGFNYRYGESKFIVNEVNPDETQYEAMAGCYTGNFNALHKLTDFMLLVSTDLIFKYSLNSLLLRYSFIEIVEQMHTENILTLIRPDGYVAYYSKNININKFLHYLDTFFGGK